MNIPNLITVLRVLLIPFFILLFYLPYSWSYAAASSVFAFAAATDWLDGYLAVDWSKARLLVPFWTRSLTS
jgi:CDP-diacylglycerol---glycerol-3-phosphate 3-phosphatidyltransferase